MHINHVKIIVVLTYQINQVKYVRLCESMILETYWKFLKCSLTVADKSSVHERLDQEFLQPPTLLFENCMQLMANIF